MPSRPLLERVANIASLIGSIDPSHIEAIIDTSNSKGLIIHGIKRAGSFDRICREGVKPLTPEGGNVSFWASGERIFGDASFPMGTFDTPFFNYSIARNDSKKVSSMNLAMTMYSELPRNEQEFEQNGVLCVPQTVLPMNLYLLQVQSSYAWIGLPEATRRTGICVAERLYEIMQKDSWRGRVERVEI